MKKTLCDILGYLTHPLLLLVYFSITLIFTRNFQYLSTENMIRLAKYIFLSVIIIPTIIHLITKVLQSIVFKNTSKMMMLMAFAVYFAILSFFGNTPFTVISIMQQLPLVLLFVAMILENFNMLQMHTLCLSGLTTAIIFTSIGLNINLLGFLITTILSIGIYSFLQLECTKSSVKTLSINCLLGTLASSIFFLLILK